MWTATDLANLIDTPFPANNNHGDDFFFVSGHFSPNAALAADYETQYISTQLRDSSIDLSGTLWLSPGCHMAYNIVNEHNAPATFEPDWAQVFADKGATVISGTGYQYGETITVDFGERLYYELVRQLRSDAGPTIPLGKALVEAKLQYLRDTDDWDSFDTKTLNQVTVWGVRNQRIDMPGPRLNLAPSTNSVVTTLQDSTKIPGDPAGQLGCRSSTFSATTPAIR